MNATLPIMEIIYLDGNKTMSTDRNFADLLLPPCNPQGGSFPAAASLQKPSVCGSKENELRQRSMKPLPDAKGGWVNNSVMFVVPKEHITVYNSQELRDISSEQVPESWDWLTKGGNMVEDGNRNQGRCGCCWAIATASALSDRYAIKYKKGLLDEGSKLGVKLSAIPIISCGGPSIGKNGYPANSQCECGGSTLAAGYWLESDSGSTRLETCWGYEDGMKQVQGGSDLVAIDCPTFAFTDDSDCCLSCCGTSRAKKHFTVKKGSTMPILVTNNDGTPNVEATIHNIKKDIMSNGPVVTTMCLPEGFQDWWEENAGVAGKILIPQGSRTKEGHSVVIVGWGTENGTDYWTIRNSWGEPAPGRKGYFKIATSPHTPREAWTGVDVAVDVDGTGNYQGGPITMLPGNLPDGDWVEGNGEGGTGPGWQPPGNSGILKFFGGNRMLMYGTIAILVLLLLIIIVSLL